MPTLDAEITISTLKQINPQVLIIIMSGLASDEVITKASGNDSQAFLAKPYTDWELLSTIEKIINQFKENDCMIYQFYKFMILRSNS